MMATALAVAACSGSTTTDTGPATDSGTGGGDGGAMAEGSTGSDSGTGTETASGTDSAADTGGGTNKPFGDPCTANGNCASNVCFMGGMGSYCSMHCTSPTQATDCPSPPTSGMCNGMHFCKK